MNPTTPPRPATVPEDDPDLLKAAWRSGPERAALLNSPRTDWARRRRNRRQLVGGYAALILGISALFALTEPNGWLIAVLVAALLVEVVLIGSLNVATRGVVGLRAEHIDERQRQIRADAYERSYRLAFPGIVVCMAALAGAAAAGFVPDFRTWLAVAHTVFGFMLMLPTLVVAWRGRD